MRFVAVFKPYKLRLVFFLEDNLKDYSTIRTRHFNENMQKY